MQIIEQIINYVLGMLRIASNSSSWNVQLLFLDYVLLFQLCYKTCGRFLSSDSYFLVNIAFE
uniref:Uncharacterized protein n=1 Tax=Anguilla anguilla TaxID=7936 RepID=A0A0E9XM72_ANGAN